MSTTSPLGSTESNNDFNAAFAFVNSQIFHYARMHQTFKNLDLEDEYTRKEVLKLMKDPKKLNEFATAVKTNNVDPRMKLRFTDSYLDWSLPQRSKYPSAPTAADSQGSNGSAMPVQMAQKNYMGQPANQGPQDYGNHGGYYPQGYGMVTGPPAVQAVYSIPPPPVPVCTGRLVPVYQTDHFIPPPRMPVGGIQMVPVPCGIVYGPPAVPQYSCPCPPAQFDIPPPDLNQTVLVSNQKNSQDMKSEASHKKTIDQIQKSTDVEEVQDIPEDLPAAPRSSSDTLVEGGRLEPKLKIVESSTEGNVTPRKDSSAMTNGPSSKASGLSTTPIGTDSKVHEKGDTAETAIPLKDPEPKTELKSTYSRIAKMNIEHRKVSQLAKDPKTSGQQNNVPSTSQKPESSSAQIHVVATNRQPLKDILETQDIQEGLSTTPSPPSDPIEKVETVSLEAESSGTSSKGSVIAKEVSVAKAIGSSNPSASSTYESEIDGKIKKKDDFAGKPETADSSQDSMPKAVLKSTPLPLQKKIDHESGRENAKEPKTSGQRKNKPSTSKKPESSSEQKHAVSSQRQPLDEIPKKAIVGLVYNPHAPEIEKPAEVETAATDSTAEVEPSVSTDKKNAKKKDKKNKKSKSNNTPKVEQSVEEILRELDEQERKRKEKRTENGKAEDASLPVELPIWQRPKQRKTILQLQAEKAVAVQLEPWTYEGCPSEELCVLEQGFLIGYREFVTDLEEHTINKTPLPYWPECPFRKANESPDLTRRLADEAREYLTERRCRLRNKRGTEKMETVYSVLYQKYFACMGPIYQMLFDIGFKSVKETHKIFGKILNIGEDKFKDELVL